MGGAGSGRKPGLYYDLARQYPRAYRSWQAMRQRCNPSNKDWKYYGGRGIKICDRWNDFSAFLADMGEHPKGLSIDRIARIEA